MDDTELDGRNRNKILSQSYSQGLEKIGCKDENTRDFELPAGLIQMREEQWDEFFRRYGKELEDDLEIAMRSDYEEEGDKNTEENSAEESDFELRQLDSDVEESDEESDGDEEEEEEGEEEEYFEKNRTPLRKTPSLIQYWIDTGRPPILMTAEPEEFRELLGEEAALKLDKLMNSMEVEVKRPSNSVFSSVDTAAYILSNTNVTAKAETIAIVEGAKSLDLNDVVKVNAEVPGCLGNQINCDTRDKNPVKNSPRKSLSTTKNIKGLKINSSLARENQTLDEIIEAPVILSFNNSSSFNKNNNNESELVSKKICNPAAEDNNNLKPRLNNNPIAQCSPKIADVLPTHEDPTKAKVIESSNISKEYDINSLKSLKLNIKNNNNINKTTANGRKPLRKKLYTQRSSPIAFLPTTPISVNSNCNDSDYFNTSKVTDNLKSQEQKMLGEMHPAFATPSAKKPKTKKIKRASWARRMSRYSKVNKPETVKSSDDEAKEGKNHSKSPEKNKSKEDLNVGLDKNGNKSGKKKLIKAKKICVTPVRQSVRSKEFVNYNENLSEEEKLADKSKEKLKEAENQKDERKKNRVEASELLKLCKELTINLERLPENYRELLNQNVTEIQNVEDSQESDESTILMYECADNKDENTDTETGTEVSRHESEDYGPQKKELEPEKRAKKPFFRRCLGSLSGKNLGKTNPSGLGSKITTRIIDDDSDDDSEAETIENFLPKKSTDKNSTKERIISFSSDEEDEFSKLLSKNKSLAKFSITKPDTSQNFDSLLDDLNSEPRFHVSSLLAVPTAVLRIIGNSDDENIISPSDLSIKWPVGVKQKKSPRLNKVLDKRKEKLNSIESESKVPSSSPRKVGVSNGFIEGGDGENVPLGLQSVDKSELSRGKLQIKVQETKNLKKTSEKNKLDRNSDKNIVKKRQSRIESDSSGETLVSPPKKIKTFSNEKLLNNNISLKSLESSPSIKLDSKISEKMSDKNKKIKSPKNHSKPELKAPVNKIINKIKNSNKKRVSFSARKTAKLLMSDENDSSDNSLFNSSKFATPSFNPRDRKDLKKSSNPRITFSSLGLKSSLSLADRNNFYRKFVSDSDDSND